MLKVCSVFSFLEMKRNRLRYILNYRFRFFTLSSLKKILFFPFIWIFCVRTYASFILMFPTSTKTVWFGCSDTG